MKVDWLELSKWITEAFHKSRTNGVLCCKKLLKSLIFNVTLALTGRASSLHVCSGSVSHKTCDKVIVYRIEILVRRLTESGCFRERMIFIAIPTCSQRTHGLGSVSTSCQISTKSTCTTDTRNESYDHSSIKPNLFHCVLFRIASSGPLSPAQIKKVNISRYKCHKLCQNH